MMPRATLVTDGASDVVLVPILRWLMRQLTAEPVEIRWADLRGFRVKPRSLAQKLAVAVREYPCQLLFVHRDAEGQDPQRRYEEIRGAVTGTACRHVCVVPVRMQEAWLLHDETALREAADRPSGTHDLGLPPPHRWEHLPDPKRVLHDALRAANGATGRRAKNFRPKRGGAPPGRPDHGLEATAEPGGIQPTGSGHQERCRASRPADGRSRLRTGALRPAASIRCSRRPSGPRIGGVSRSRTAAVE